MSAPILLLAACAEWFATLRPIKSVAKYFDLEPSDLHGAINNLHAHTFRGKLQSALEAPEDRPDLIFHKTQLARLEHQLALLAKQFDRAECSIEGLENLPGGYDVGEMHKAEVFANRIHQQTVRLLRDIQKAHLLLEKAASAPPDSITEPANPPASGGRKSFENSASTNSEQESPENTTPIDQDSSLAANPQPPTEEEFLLCIVKNRQRIKSTPAKERPALITRLIEEHRAKSTSRAA